MPPKQLATKAKAPLPEGLAVGDTVYFKGPSQQWEPAGHSLAHGCVGKLVGPAVPGVSIWSSTLATPVTPQFSVSMQFTGNPGPVNIHAQELSREPLPELPGGWKVGVHAHIHMHARAVCCMPRMHAHATCFLLTCCRSFSAGDKVWYSGPSYAFASGNKVSYGGRGEVAGPATTPKPKPKPKPKPTPKPKPKPTPTPTPKPKPTPQPVPA